MPGHADGRSLLEVGPRSGLQDRACVDAILEAARTLPAVGTLGINAHASTLAMGSAQVALSPVDGDGRVI